MRAAAAAPLRRCFVIEFPFRAVDARDDARGRLSLACDRLWALSEYPVRHHVRWVPTGARASNDRQEV